MTHRPTAARRWKTYSAESGYVFEYIFIGEPQPGVYRFDVSWDRKTTCAIAVELDLLSLAETATRELGTVERFAVAKLSLRDAFDSCESPDTLRTAPFRPERARLREILHTLDLL